MVQALGLLAEPWLGQERDVAGRGDSGGNGMAIAVSRLSVD